MRRSLYRLVLKLTTLIYPCLDNSRDLHNIYIFNNYMHRRLEELKYTFNKNFKINSNITYIALHVC